MKTLLITLFILSFAAGYALTGHADSGTTTFDTVDPSVSVTAPASGATWFIGYSHNITWDATDSNFPAEPIQIRYSTDSGSSFSTLNNANANSGLYPWVATAPPSETAKVQIIATDSFGNSASAENSGLFSIRYVPPPQISNILAQQRTDGSKIIDIWYDLEDANNDLCEVGIIISENNGVSYTYIPAVSNLSGDYGEGINPGTGKHIVWAAGSESRTFDASTFRIRITADDGTYPPNPENFVYVQGGSFDNSFRSYYNVTVSSFFINQYELTQAEYQAVMGTNPANGYGVGNNYPVYNVSWYDAIEYCNRRSINESLNPCYSYDTYGTDPNNWPAGWNQADTLSLLVSCNWSANGYRLPTEAESYFAGIGGTLTHGYDYAGSNILDNVGWHDANSAGATHQVGMLMPNELNLYDMTGNIQEWCWDIGNPNYNASNLTDPHGATEFWEVVMARHLRGMSFMDNETGMHIYRANWGLPTMQFQSFGIRLARTTY